MFCCPGATFLTVGYPGSQFELESRWNKVSKLQKKYMKTSNVKIFTYCGSPYILYVPDRAAEPFRLRTYMFEGLHSFTPSDFMVVFVFTRPPKQAPF